MKDLRTNWPHFRYVGEGVSETACYSRYPLEDLAPVPDSEMYFAPLLAKVKLPDKTVSLISIHPPVPIHPTPFLSRNEQLSLTATMAKTLPGPVVVIGDFNCTPWSPYFTKFVRESGLVNARDDFGILPTWPTFLPPMMIPIDHCLVSSEVKVVHCRTGENIGSDHLPLIVDLVISERK